MLFAYLCKDSGVKILFSLLSCLCKETTSCPNVEHAFPTKNFWPNLKCSMYETVR